MHFLSHQGLILGMLTGGIGYVLGEWWTVLFGIAILIPSLVVCHFYFDAGVRRQEEIAVGYGCLLQAGLYYGYIDLFMLFEDTPESEKWRLWFWLVALLLLASRIMLTLFPGGETEPKVQMGKKTIEMLNEWNKDRSE